MILVAVLIFLAASVPPTIIVINIDENKDAGYKKEKIKSELIWAARDGNAANLEKLLVAGADPNSKNSMDESALLCAVESGNLASVEVLLNHGADPNGGHWDKPFTPLLSASYNLQMVKTLVAHGADVNLGNQQGNTALELALGAGKTEAAQFLIEHGADNNKKIDKLEQLKPLRK